VALSIYDTLTRGKQEFTPGDPDHVRMYVCGPTVYDFAHIGNARPVVVFDVLYRLLRSLYPRVTYVRNITDVDDKIIAAAEKSGEDISAITARCTDAFHADMAALGALEPDAEPRATDHIPQMIAMIECLIATGHGYEADGHVLFAIDSMPDYGALSRHSRDELVAGARVEVAPYKKDPADFVLWKPSDDGQPGWDSPWGRGRPGWHLECSVMSEEHLGPSFDIHGGGQDLIFPHHENEIAQSVCSHGGKPFVKYWMHNGYVTVDGEKMSKSVGNFFTVHELLEKAPGEAIRYALLMAHYRQPLDFSHSALQQATGALDRLYGALRRTAGIAVEAAKELPAQVLEALADDLNTPKALAELHDLASALNKAEDSDSRARLGAALRDGGKLLGLLQHDPEEWFQGAPHGDDGLDVAGIETMIARRAEARAKRDFTAADAIRDELAETGVVLEDKPDGTTIWKRTQ
jgi:cysteinyl-tRNA synthetase